MKTVQNTLILLSIAITIASCSYFERKKNPIYTQAVGQYEKDPEGALMLLDSLMRGTLQEETLASAFYLKGLILKRSGALHLAAEAYKKSLHYWKELENPQWISYTVENLGNVYMDGGMWQEALDLYSKSDENSPYLDYNKGRALAHLQNYTEAQEHYFAAELAWRGNRDKGKDLIDLYNQMGIMYKKLHLYENSEKYLYYGLVQSDNLENYLKSELYINLSNTFYKQGRIDESLESYKNVLAYADSSLYVLAFYRIGDLYREMAQEDSALVYYGRAVRHYEGTHHDEYVNSINHIINHHAAAGQYDSMMVYSMALNETAVGVMKFREEMQAQLQQLQVIISEAEHRHTVTMLEKDEQIRQILYGALVALMVLCLGLYRLRHRLGGVQYKLLLKTKTNQDCLIEQQGQTIKQLREALSK